MRLNGPGGELWACVGAVNGYICLSGGSGLGRRGSVNTVGALWECCMKREPLIVYSILTASGIRIRVKR